MKNYWFITRPKRKLISVPEILSAFIAGSLNDQWTGQVGKHIDFEEVLEKQGLKRRGDRRDQGGSGGRTYVSWLFSLGLFFKKDGKIQTTLAGDALLNGEPPVEILKHQVLKFQYPSPYSILPAVRVSDRFRIRPVLFILKLIMDNRIEYLTQEEIAKIVITEAENESEKNFQYIIERILAFRNFGDSVLPTDFNELYPSRSGVQSFDKTVSMLSDIANTFINWIEYTQLAARDEKHLKVVPGQEVEIAEIIENSPNLITRWEDEEYFQRRYGVDPWHRKDTRNLNETRTVTAQLIAQKMVRTKFLSMAAKSPITEVNTPIIESIYSSTGITHSIIEEELASFANGALDSFEASYFDMSLKGRDQCREFELATVELFQKAFDFDSSHVGDKGKHPDVLAVSEDLSGIIDSKAYASYTISNDHKNRMVHNYIPPYINKIPNLEFFMYISGGFGKNFDKQVELVAQEANIRGCGITANNIIKLAREYKSNNWKPCDLKRHFTLNREIRRADFT
ncbi:hypothetical protein J2T56_003003 [Natronobacillus azotifigens]|uniref:Restriction endonuclease n=1 Tax=Natronobacillus azotifigens TaxID=472978 RepID=A0A9J6RH74_9BACI|nr:restriction endonuclease FokI C-terminal domain-containing protein [Natronobacillus azotifigens]MCZ0704481.1 hypothetical protein [Natronobacillus azotifigens]